MSWKKAAGILLAVVLLCVGGFFAYKEFQYRQVNGRVVEVNSFSWGQEVSRTKDDKPVLVYFYDRGDQPEQLEAVSNIAWWYAGKVKVVAVDGGRLDNLPLEVRYKVGDHPAFLVLYKNKLVRGPEGRFVSRRELSQLIEAARQP